jgi:outer membrane protein assembly factor BamD
MITRIHTDFILWLLLLSIGLGCAEKEFDPSDPAKSYQIAKEPYDDKEWDRALTKLSEFKARFPYSQYAIEAELLIANAHFELEQFAEAAANYEQFVKLRPKHPKVDYAMFRVGESYWQDAPEEVDREQDYTIRAVEEWENLIQAKPDSEYAKKAQPLIIEGNRRVAGSYEFAADFYCKLEVYHACAYRFVKLAQEFPQFQDLKDKAFKEASRALLEVAKQKDADPKSDKNIYFRDFSAEEIRALASELKAQKIPERIRY